MNNFKNTRLFWLIKNICVFWRCDLYKEIEELKLKQKELDQATYPACFINKIFNYFIVNPEKCHTFENELQFLASNPDNIIFPYKHTKTLTIVNVEYDNYNRMFYVTHNNKKLYFPSKFTKDKVSFIYRNYIETENILGGKYCEKAPHQYESDFCKVEEGDVLLDIGCAEALFALHHIEKVKKAYLIESDPYWTDALKATFKPYAEKVVFVNKLITDTETESTTTLSSILKNETNESIFIKMDIEGYEQMVLKSSIEFLSTLNNIKISCCTYHRQNDFEEISTLLNCNGFLTEASEGYMIFPLGEIMPPYFRKGVIRAYK